MAGWRAFRYHPRTMRPILQCLAAATLAAALFAGWCFHQARQAPVVRRATVELAAWPAGAPAMRVVLLSDIHIGSLAMDAARLSRIVEQVNALRPDVVLLAGDFIAGHDGGLARRWAPALVGPLSRLEAPLGKVAVLGNHDYWTGAGPVRAAFAAAGVDVLDNDARRYGTLTVVGIDDRFTRHDRIDQAMQRARTLPGPRLVLSHDPDIVPDLPADAPLVAAGHMHCGQLVLPLVGPPRVPSDYGRRYLCGVIREGGRATIVTGGLGTSAVPLRFRAPPDLWLLTLRGVSQSRS